MQYYTYKSGTIDGQVATCCMGGVWVVTSGVGVLHGWCVGSIWVVHGWCMGGYMGGWYTGYV